MAAWSHSGHEQSRGASEWPSAACWSVAPLVLLGLPNLAGWAPAWRWALPAAGALAAAGLAAASAVRRRLDLALCARRTRQLVVEQAERHRATLAERRRERLEATRAPSGTPLPGPGFEQMASRAFVELCHAACRGDLEEVGDLLSDGVRSLLEAEIAPAKAHGARLAVAEPTVIACGLEDAWLDDEWVTAIAGLQARVRVAEVPTDLPFHLALARAARSPLREVRVALTFSRRVTGQADNPCTPNRCPRCGEPRRWRASACSRCGEVLSGGRWGWVLTALVLGGAGRAPLPPAPLGFGRLKATDPAFSPVLLSDRAALVLSAASRSGNPAVPPGFGATGRVRLEGIRPLLAEQDASTERAHVWVRWRWAGLPRSSVLTLVRRSGAHSSPDNGLATRRCPGCGEPPPEAWGRTCAACGTPASDDWQLAGFLSPEGFLSAPAALPREAGPFAAAGSDLGDPWERSRLFGIMVAVLAPDGAVGASERPLLEGWAERWDLPRALLDRFAASGADALADARPRGIGEARQLVATLASAAHLDGRLDEQEHATLLALARRLGLGEDDVAILVGRPSPRG